MEIESTYLRDECACVCVRPSVCVPVSRGRWTCVGECNGNVTIPLVTLSSGLCAFRSNMFRVVFRYCNQGRTETNEATKFLCLMRVRVHICLIFVGERTNNGFLSIQEHTQTHECDPYIFCNFQSFDKEVCASTKKFFGSNARCAHVWVCSIEPLIHNDHFCFHADVRVYASCKIYSTEKCYLFSNSSSFFFPKKWNKIVKSIRSIQIFNNQIILHDEWCAKREFCFIHRSSKWRWSRCTYNNGKSLYSAEHLPRYTVYGLYALWKASRWKWKRDEQSEKMREKTNEHRVY